MKKTALAALLLAALLLSGCAGEAPAAAVPSPSAPSAPSPSPEPTPPEPSSAPTPEPSPSPEPTPDLSPLPDSWFEDAAFFGDSLTVSLEKYCLSSGDFGDALFFGEYSYSMEDALGGGRPIWYENKPRKLEDVVAACGAKKLCLMLGNNDLAYYGGVDELMERWEELVSRLLEQQPDAVLFLESALPVFRGAEREGWNNALMDEYNQRLRSFCDAHEGCVFVDLAPALKDENNCLDPSLCSDMFCHLTPEGLGIWIRGLKDPANYSVDPRSVDND